MTARPVFIYKNNIMYKFISKSHVAINVTLGNGSNKHISFSEVTGGASFYITNNPEIASAIRKHPRYGRLFKEEAVAEPPKVEKKKEKPTENKENQLIFANNEDAKDYISETYGVSRSKMRTTAAIEGVASNLGITIIWNK